MEQAQLIIGGRDVAAKNAGTFARHNPITGEEATRAAAATAEDAKAAADAAAAAFPKWSALGPSARRAILNKAADLLEQRAQQFATLVMAETGATAGWGHFNIHLAAGMLREAGAMTTQIQGEVVPSDVPGNMAMAIRQPVGVILGIAPWNAPIILGVRAVAMPSRLRQHRHPQGVGSVPGHASPDRGDAARRGHGRWRHQRHHARAEGRGKGD